ncbi:hypothetical protein EDC04DRAFT_2823931 [Pisolithus marmoratus]|nr:hypothetical protein EDC04DRAFT_2823931 [Pisolithus marmoratus]
MGLCLGNWKLLTAILFPGLRSRECPSLPSSWTDLAPTSYEFHIHTNAGIDVFTTPTHGNYKHDLERAHWG